MPGPRDTCPESGSKGDKARVCPLPVASVREAGAEMRRMRLSFGGFGKRWFMFLIA